MAGPDLSGKSGCEMRRDPGNHLMDIRICPYAKWRIQILSDIPEVIARISSHFTSGFSGQIRILHPDKFRYP